MTQDENTTDTPAAQILNFAEESAQFDEEQEVATKSWYLPTRTVESLRTYIIGQYGTPKHIGAFCTHAMLNWVQETPSDDAHITWAHLKNDYAYDGVDVAEWNYRNYRDYTEIDQEQKTALGFSAPAVVIKQFTDELTKNEYGSELANAVEAELLKMAQIAQMQALINGDDAKRKVEEEPTPATTHKVEVSEKGERVNLDNIKLSDTTATLDEVDIKTYAEANNEIGWETRRGLLGAYARGMSFITKDKIYTLDEMELGVEKPRSRRKDYNALLAQAESNDDPLTIAPAEHIRDAMGATNLVTSAGLTKRNNPLKYDSDDFDYISLEITLYNKETTSEEMLLDDIIEFLWDYTENLADYDWKGGDSVKRTYEGKFLKDTIIQIVPVLVTIQSLDGDEFDLTDTQKDDILNMINKIGETRKSIKGEGGKDIEEAYKYFQSQNIKPTSKQFQKNHS